MSEHVTSFHHPTLAPFPRYNNELSFKNRNFFPTARVFDALLGVTTLDFHKSY